MKTEQKYQSAHIRGPEKVKQSKFKSNFSHSTVNNFAISQQLINDATSGGFNGRPHVQWPMRPQHNGLPGGPRVLAL